MIKSIQLLPAIAYLRRWVDGELQLGLLAVVHRQTLHQQGGEARPRSSTEGMEDEEALQTGALVSQLADLVENHVDDLLADGVVASGIVIGGVLLACHQLVGVEQVFVVATADLICNDMELDVCTFAHNARANSKGTFIVS